MGGRCLSNPYDDDLFYWWNHHIISINNYPYERIDFIQDLNMLVPPGEAFDGIGKHFLSF
jgi:hypothetical protein